MFFLDANNCLNYITLEKSSGTTQETTNIAQIVKGSDQSLSISSDNDGKNKDDPVVANRPTVEGNVSTAAAAAMAAAGVKAKVSITIKTDTSICNLPLA